MEVLIMIATVLGITFSTGPKEVPTSLCHDPLLGPSMIIYSDCGGAQEESDKDQSRKTQQPADQKIPQSIAQSVGQPTDEFDDQSEEQPVEQYSELPDVQSAERSAEKPKAKKQKCNKGSGNGAEGCDPGNHPEKGNNDEGGDRHPQNNKKDKKH